MIDDNWNEGDKIIDPICTFHGKRMSEHDCLYCAICFKTITPEECAMENVRKVDVCLSCYQLEQQRLVMKHRW